MLNKYRKINTDLELETIFGFNNANDCFCG